MRRIFRAALAVLASAGTLVVALPAAPASASGGSISGRVTLPSGQAAGDICVHAAPWFSGTDGFATTGADGSYQISVPDGTYKVEFKDCGSSQNLVTGWWPQKLDENQATTLTVSGAPLTGIDEQMVQGGRIVGRVLDRQGLPISDAQVLLQAPGVDGYSGLEMTRTSTDGAYVLPGVAPGSWQLLAERQPTYAGTFSGDTDDPKSAALFDVTAGAATTASDIHMGRAATISGTVLDELGNPRAGVCVSAWGSAETVELTGAQTASDGSYTLTGVYPGTDRVSVSACQGALAWYQDGDSYAHATPIDVGEGAAVSGIDMTLPNGPVISGTVTDENGDPVPGVRITLFDGVTYSSTNGYAVTDANGHYLISGLQSKLYIVEADPSQSSRPDLVQRFWPVAPTRATAVPLAASVATTGIDFGLAVGGSITGHVTAAATGAVLPKICVMARAADPDESRGVTTAADGSYLIQGLDSGDYDVTYEDCNHIYNVVSTYWHGTDLAGSGSKASVTIGQPLTGVDEAMQPGGSMHGRVVDDAGNPLARMCLYVATSDGSISYGGWVTDSSGTWQTSGLAPSRSYSVSVHACDSSAPWVPKSLPDHYSTTAGGDTGVPDLVLHHGGSFSGTVTDQYGHPVDGACVESLPSDSGGTASYFRTSINGTYTGGGLEPGTYSAYFIDCGVGMVSTYWKSPDYATRATFTVTSDHTTTGVDQTVVIYTLPSAPTDVVVQPGDGEATLSWQPPASSGHTDITGYQVSGPSGTTSLSPQTRSYRVTGLSNGSSYQLSVAAVNAKGVGAAQVARATLLPVQSVSLAGPTSVLSGHAAGLHGRVLLTDGSGADSRPVTLYRRPAGSTLAWQQFAVARTDTAGRWSAMVWPRRPTAYRVVVGGVSARWTQRVAPIVADTLAFGRFHVATSPARPGASVLVMRRRADGSWLTWLRSRLDDQGRLVVRLGTGRWRACLPAASSWSASCGPVVRIS
ncbi:MAG TPA: carboxypeptidase regulatory-like domain-containing protein [Mycobacteriales bacterium]|nr:carboxypeptidase regulatory-like domain-containing protein [Mycobacteriales bacterium]